MRRPWHLATWMTPPRRTQLNSKTTPLAVLVATACCTRAGQAMSQVDALCLPAKKWRLRAGARPGLRRPEQPTATYGRQTYPCFIMKEIRLRWLPTRKTSVDGHAVECGPCCPDTDASRRELGEVPEAGLQVCGDGSHWLQERESQTLDGHHSIAYPPTNQLVVGAV